MSLLKAPDTQVRKGSTEHIAEIPARPSVVPTLPEMAHFARLQRLEEILIAQFRESEDERVAKELAKQEEEQELEFRTRRNNQVGEFGNKKSKWERLWDANEGLPYWMNWESQESLWERPVICHVCDAAIPDDDVMCFKCKNARSEYNQRIYDELHPL